MDVKTWAAEARAKLNGREVVVSISGGKDSTATALLLREGGIDFRAIHMDTGWEHEDTESYVRDYLPTLFGPIEILQGKHGGMEQLVIKRGMFPSRMRRFCTQELKVRPFLAWLRRTVDEEGVDLVNAVGIRSAESPARANLAEWEWSDSYDCEVWRPIIRWTLADVIAIHHRHGARPNPLYLRGATRVGCWPCIFARKGEVRMIADTDPGRVDRIRALEEAVSEAARQRYDEQGETFESKGLAEPTWFQNPTSRRAGDTKRAGDCWSIDRVIEWARGGKEGDDELFAANLADEGCMRWGLCETNEPEGNQERFPWFSV